MSLTDFGLMEWRGLMTRLATDEFAAFIGLDWADAKHDICLQVAGWAYENFGHLIQYVEGVIKDFGVKHKINFA